MQKKKLLALLLACICTTAALSGCGTEKETKEMPEAETTANNTDEAKP